MKSAVALLTLALGSHQATAADTPPLLQRMLDAADKVSFRGHGVQIVGNQVQSLHIVHKAGAQGGEDRVRSLQGAYWELHRSGMKCRVSHPEAPVRVAKLAAAAFPSLWPRGLIRLAEFYHFVPAGKGRMANRPVEFTIARPRDRFRFAYLLATDAATGLLLGVSVLDDHHEPLRQLFIVDIELLPAGSEATWLEPTDTPLTKLPWIEQACTEPLSPNEMPWRVGVLPAGFQVGSFTRRPLPGSDKEIDQLNITDGLIMVSVFIDKPAPGEQMLVGPSENGAGPAFGGKVGGRHVTALGAVPIATLQSIVQALIPVDSPRAAAPGGLSATSNGIP